jgi:hypothetical protein
MKEKKPIPPLRAAAYKINKLIREGADLPKPRVEVKKVPKGFAWRLIDKYGRKGEWSKRLTLRNNTRRAARKAHPELPVISQ